MGREREAAMAAVLEAWRSTSAAITSWCVSALWSGLRRRHRRTAYALGAGAGGLKLNYDALSYAQNFDDGSRPGECEPDFTARFAPAAGPRRPSSVASCCSY
ncbi:hypothetical protein D1007_37882 [Hordeum vulgare]|uniref:Predicted protein n=1 Tax=Hordeum vulgare subsp. vulgare TaxID=112509 RepID=F2CPX7_HORVV|nr:uncharacterized protein LOC123403374 [Hordeum vulgare subsp. vulgare]KAE8788098.1 hypothetical protein D1007_37882 [Hordeum vulgare]KAI4980997.1 hypothetical protein ZWY2020_021482 [Hordeum vulgare]BAJ84898.1 predicted protein [Hordeum vulgare subsp. vulgare]BAJ91033.1 predicted protein [Hordeum vulgare subsp. vulgare]